ncbi:MAG: PepSY domain-containing protein [Flavobacteriaceae bacterium]|nr:PepSY domain-containing protein [Flavobacteriaceae bacterium]
MKFSKIIKKTHLILGLTVGLISSISGLTGSMYVFEPEITAVINNELLSVKLSGKPSYVASLKTVVSLQEVHKDSISSVSMPFRGQQTLAVQYGTKNTYYYHPITGDLIGTNAKSVVFFEWLLQLHRNLHLPNYGKYIIGVSSLLFAFLIVLSGFYMWWRIYKTRWKRGVSLSLGDTAKKINFHLHRIAGIYFFIPLFIIAVTGSYFTFDDAYEEALESIPYFQQTTISKVILPEVGEAFNLLESSLLMEGSYKLRLINYPTSKRDGYRFRYVNNLEVSSGLRKKTDIKTAVNLKILKVSSYETTTLATKIFSQMYPIHMGESLGIGHRLLVFFAGLIPVLLFVTGLRYYLFRKQS